VVESATETAVRTLRRVWDRYEAGIQWGIDYFGKGTVGLALLLIAWYLLEWVYFISGGTAAGFEYWFAATSVMDPTPGLFLSTFSHNLANHAFGFSKHLLGNLVFILIAGRLVEQHVRSRWYVFHFLTVATVATVSSIAISQMIGEPASSMGASGGALGLVGLYAGHALREHRGPVREVCNTVLIGLRGGSQPDTHTGISLAGVVDTLVIALAILAAGMSGLQLVGIMDPGRANVIAHLAGLGLGAVFGVHIPDRWADCINRACLDG
jgi:membrane associated rhomboid family serine protease